MAARSSSSISSIKQELEVEHNEMSDIRFNMDSGRTSNNFHPYNDSSPLKSYSGDVSIAQNSSTNPEEDGMDLEQDIDDGDDASLLDGAESEMNESTQSMINSSREGTSMADSMKRKSTAEAEGAPASKKATSKSRGKRKVDEGPVKQRKRKAANNIVMSRPIGRSFEECDEWDKMLITWRDQNKSWVVIRQKWEEMTGEKTGISTIPNRYNRLKDNFSTIQEEHQKVLLEVKREVEAQFALKKWDIIASEMKGKCKARYNPDTLKRQYKKLMLKAGIRGPNEAQKQNGVVDPDFDARVSEDEA